MDVLISIGLIVSRWVFVLFYASFGRFLVARSVVVHYQFQNATVEPSQSYMSFLRDHKRVSMSPFYGRFSIEMIS